MPKLKQRNRASGSLVSRFKTAKRRLPRRDKFGRFTKRRLPRRDKLGHFVSRKRKRTAPPVSKVSRIPRGSLRPILATKFFASYRKISRGKPSLKWYHPKYGVFSPHKVENGKTRFQTAAIFCLVMAPMRVKTSQPSPKNLRQVWIRRVMLAAPRGIKYWSAMLQPGRFLYSEMEGQVESSGGILLSILGFEGVK